MEIVGQVGLGALGAALQLVADGGVVLLHQVILQALLASEESAAVLAVDPGLEGTEAEFPASSASLLALVLLPIRVAHVAGLAVVRAVHEA